MVLQAWRWAPSARGRVYTVLVAWRWGPAPWAAGSLWAKDPPHPLGPPPGL